MAKTIADYKADFAAAQARGDQAGMNAAHAGAEAVRAQSGYSGGADGSQVIVTNQAKYDAVTKGQTGSTNGKVTTGYTGAGSSSSASSSSTYTGDGSWIGSGGLGTNGTTVSNGSTNTQNTNTGASTSTSNTSKYTPTSNASTNSQLWRDVQADTTLTQDQKTALQTALHDANTKLNAGQTFNSNTGTWSGNQTNTSNNYTYTSGNYSQAGYSGANNDSVKAIQQALNKWIASGAAGTQGLSALAVDGSYGPNTQAAVLAYQKANNLKIDGQVGNQTATALGLTGSQSQNTANSTSQYTSAQDQIDRNTYWDSSWDQYGSSANFKDAAQRAMANNDLEAAAKIEYARNQYLEATGNTTYTPETYYISQYEVPGTISEKTNIGGNIVTYTFQTVDGETHQSARTVSGDPIPTGTTIAVDVQTDADGNEYTTYWTWIADGYRDDTGMSAYTTEQTGKSDTTNNSYYESSFWDSQIYDYLNEQLNTGEQAAIDANKAATEQSVLEIKAQLENGLAQYETSAAEAYLQMMQNQDNLALTNAAAGNFGGIAQKQLTTAQAAYDQQLLTIALERQYFINTCNQTIAQLEAEGRYNEANIISEWAQEKIEVMNQTYQWYEEMAFQQEQFEFEKEQFAYEQETTDRNYAYQRALSLLEQGMITTDAVEALGISEADAKAYTDRLNLLADLNIQEAKQELAQIASSNSGAVVETTSTQNTGEMTINEYNNFMNLLANDSLPVYNAQGTLVGTSGVDGYGNLTVPMKDGYYTVVTDGGRKFYYSDGGFTTTDTYSAKVASETASQTSAALGSEYEALTGKGYVNPTNALAYLESMQRVLTNKLKAEAQSLGNIDQDVMYQYSKTYRELYDQLVAYNNLIAKFNGQ